MEARYNNGKIYKIVNEVNSIIYVGSTCTTLSRRFSWHKSFCRRGHTSAIYAAMCEIGIEKFRIILIENYSTTEKNLLLAREQHWIDYFKSEDVALYNCINAFGFDKQQYQAQYKIDHVDQIKQNMARYRRNNADQIKKKINCACGGKYTKTHQPRHFRSIIHQIFETDGLNLINI